MKGIDFFGKAVLEYPNSEEEFFFEDPHGNRTIKDLHRYYRDIDEFSRLERRAIDNVKGRVLDVGCATGNITRYLGDAKGIDVSEAMIAIAKHYKVEAEVADIFNFESEEKFDTITLFENNIGIGGSLEMTEKLLEILKGLLKDDGRILAIAKNVLIDYVSFDLIPIWKGRKGERFSWMAFNWQFLKYLCEAYGLKMKILDSEGERYLASLIF